MKLAELDKEGRNSPKSWLEIGREAELPILWAVVSRPYTYERMVFHGILIFGCVHKKTLSPCNNGATPTRE